mgnify:CR=1 FL=1
MAKKKMTIEDLAKMIQRGFEETAGKKYADGRFDKLEDALTRFIKATEDNFNQVYRRLDLVRDDVSYLPTMRQELRVFQSRLDRLEKRVSAMR